MDTSSPLNRALALFNNSQTALAQAVGVAQPSISKAVKRGKASLSLAIKIESATGGRVTCHELRPDIWPAPNGAAA